MDASASNSGPDDRADAHDVVATYPDLESARAAMTILERHGVEGAHIELHVPDAEGNPLADDAQRDADMAATGQVGKRAGIGLVAGAAIGAVVGALIGAAASLVFDIANVLALALGGAFGGAGFGAYAGGFYGGATGLPVTEAWGESYAADERSSVGEPPPVGPQRQRRRGRRGGASPAGDGNPTPAPGRRRRAPRRRLRSPPSEAAPPTPR